MNNAEIDSFSIADLEARYGVNRSNLYKRVNALKEKGYSLDFETRDRKVYANSEQVKLLDRMHSHIQTGSSMHTFPDKWEDFEPNDINSYLARQSELSHKTRDTNGSGSAIAKQSTQLIALSPEQLIELATAIAPVAPVAETDPFEKLEQIDRACRNDWHLSSSQLAPLLNRQSMPSKAFKQFGYRFYPEGKNGREKAWRIQKDHLLLPDDNL